MSKKIQSDIKWVAGLCSGIAKNKIDVIKDSIGDCNVVLIILSAQCGCDKPCIYDTFPKIFSMENLLLNIANLSGDVAKWQKRNITIRTAVKNQLFTHI